MDFVDFGRYAGGLLVTLGLLAIALVALRRFGPGMQLGAPSAPNRRVTLVENRMVDAKRRIIVARFAGHDHLILLGAASEQLIASAQAADPDDTGAA